MSKQQRLEEKLAIYRELSPADRRRLQADLEGDPAAAELLAAYQEMDRRLATLPRPAPSPRLRRRFLAALDRETDPGRKSRFRSLVERGPALAGQVALGGAVLLALVALAYLFRQQLQLAAAPGTGTPTAVAALPEAGPIGTPAPTPTPAASVDAANPFAPFRESMASWPEQTGMAHGALRAGMTAYLQQLGSIEALADPAPAADLQAQLAPAVPAWGEQSLQLLELVPSSPGRELVLAILPFVDVYRQDADGVFHVEGLGPPGYWPVEETWPRALEAVDFSGDGVPELAVTYEHAAPSRLMQEVLVAQYEPARRYWGERLRLPLVDAAAVEAAVSGPAGILALSPAAPGEPGVVETRCLASGPFDNALAAPAVRRDVYAWYGGRFEPLLFDRSEPSNLRQYVDLSETFLQEGQIREALRRYLLLANGEIGLPNTDAGRPDWEAFAGLRAGQLHALLGEPEAAREALGRALLSSNNSGRLAAVFAEAYEASGDAAAAWAALLADPALYEAGYLGGESGEPAGALPVLYPGLALAAALRQAELPQADGLQPEDLLPLWAAHGLETTGRVLDIDLDGAPEVIAAQFLPGGETPLLSPVWVLDVGEDGWFAARLGELPAGWRELPPPEPGPGGAYQMLQLGSTYAGWDGRYAHHFQGSYYSDETHWLRSTRPEYVCPLRAGELVVANQAILDGATPTAPAPSPSPVRPTLDARSLTATAAPILTATPTPWDGHQDNMISPTPVTPSPSE